VFKCRYKKNWAKSISNWSSRLQAEPRQGRFHIFADRKHFLTGHTGLYRGQEVQKNSSPEGVRPVRFFLRAAKKLQIWQLRTIFYKFCRPETTIPKPNFGRLFRELGSYFLLLLFQFEFLDIFLRELRRKKIGILARKIRRRRRDRIQGFISIGFIFF
jgi:hypothetical protein